MFRIGRAEPARARALLLGQPRLPRRAPRRSCGGRRRGARRAVAPIPSCRAATLGRSRSMRPAALANLICGVGVETLAGAQLLDQLKTQLEVASLLVLLTLDLAQPVARSTNHEVSQPHPLPTTAQRIQRLTDGGRLGDRMARMTSRHPS